MANEKDTFTVKKVAAPIKGTATVKAEDLKTEVKTEVKATPAKAAATPAKAAAPAKKPAAKKATTTKKTTAAKKPAAKKPATKKAAAKKTVLKTSAVFALDEGKNVSAEALMKKYLQTAKDRCKYDLGLKTADIKSIDIYVNLAEKKVYSVVNGEINDSFDMYLDF
jgi:hypothetical protein